MAILRRKKVDENIIRLDTILKSDRVALENAKKVDIREVERKRKAKEMAERIAAQALEEERRAKEFAERLTAKRIEEQIEAERLAEELRAKELEEQLNAEDEKSEDKWEYDLFRKIIGTGRNKVYNWFQDRC